MNLGKNIYNLRKKNGISQEKLAEEIGVSRQTISNWELGETAPNTNQLLVLAKVLNTNLDKLIEGELDYLNEKIKNTENIVKKHLKINKMLFISIYFLVLITLIFFMIIILTKKDFTKDYQTEFTCNLNGEIRDIYLEEVDGKYIIVNGEEKYHAGDNISEVFSSLETIKEFYISQGATCK